MSKVIELKNDVKLRSKEILEMLGHVVDNIYWLPIFDEHNHALIEFTNKCERKDCAHSFILSPDEYGNIELSCLFEVIKEFPEQNPQINYHIADIQCDETINNKRYANQLGLFTNEPATYLEEPLDRTGMISVLRRSERMQWVVCPHLKIML